MRRWTTEEGRSEGAPGRWLPIMGLAVAALTVGLVATTFVPAPHNGGDNAGYITLAQSLQGGRYVDLWDSTLPAHTKYPPVFPALLAGLVAGGAATWTALKTVPAVFTVLAVLLAYAWAAQRRNPFFGAGVAALTGLSSAYVWSSHWILSDPTFLAFTFLALWALDRAGGVGGDAVDGRVDGPAAAGDPPLRTGWLSVGVAAAVLAYFTRSAGLPLLAAMGVWLVLRRRWVALGLFGLVAGVPAVAWWLRARAVGDVDYVGEFWMVDPYTPGLGRVGPGGLVERFVDNLQGYVGTWIPEGLVGTGGGWVTLLGVALVGLAAIGWARRSRGGGPGAAEIFLPLYAGLILLWPQVWSGDRFALPLFPLLLFYAGETVAWLAERWGRAAARVALLAAAAVVAVPASASWSTSVRQATACGSAVRTGGAWACYGAAWSSFADAARWAGANLPERSAVLTRKPRIFYVLGGVPGRTYPFVMDPDAFMEEAEAAGARYVVLDYLDAQGSRYVGTVIQGRPGAFCAVRTFPARAGTGVPPTQLLGILPSDSELGGSMVEGGGRTTAALPPCPPDLRPATEVEPAPLDPAVIPLLVEGRG